MALNNESSIKQSSEIQNHFSGASVFLTGATGFVGMLLLEKLLRTCADMKMVYILVRKKSNICAEERIHEILGDQLFDRIRNTQPKFADKVVLLEGDCALPFLGLSESAKDIIINEVNCIFHSAATTRFNEKLLTATYINVRATKDLLHLAKKIKYLKSFIYISTAYANCNRYEVGEKFYEPMITGDRLISVVTNLNEDSLEKITPILLGGHPNTYTFTKSVAEEVIRTYSQDLPIAVIRPSIILSTAKEPVAGWSLYLYGPVAVVFWMSTGSIRTLMLKKDCITDIVPADYLVNCIISVAWEIGTTSKHAKHEKDVAITPPEIFEHGQLSENTENKTKSNAACKEFTMAIGMQAVADIPIFNYVSFTEKPIRWGAVIDYGKHHYRSLAKDSRTSWNYCLITCSSYIKYIICNFLLQTAPAYIVDYAGKCIGKNFNSIKKYRKARKLCELVAYFPTREWKFENKNTQALWRKLNSEDRKIYNFDLSNFDWNNYFETFIKGTVKYLEKQPLDLLPAKRRNGIAAKTVRYAIILLTLFVIHTLLKLLWDRSV